MSEKGCPSVHVHFFRLSLAARTWWLSQVLHLASWEQDFREDVVDPNFTTGNFDAGKLKALIKTTLRTSRLSQDTTQTQKNPNQHCYKILSQHMGVVWLNNSAQSCSYSSIVCAIIGHARKKRRDFPRFSTCIVLSHQLSSTVFYGSQTIKDLPCLHCSSTNRSRLHVLPSKNHQSGATSHIPGEVSTLEAIPSLVRFSCAIASCTLTSCESHFHFNCSLLPKFSATFTNYSNSW